MNAPRANLDRSPRTAVPHRRGVSLLEVMIALAIVIATAALVLPWTAGWLGDRELDQAEDQLAMQLLMARAAAREQGRPVEIVVDGGAAAGVGRTGSVEARWMSPALIPNDDGSNDAGSSDDDLPSLAGPDGAPPAIKAAWARFELPRGVRVALEGDDTIVDGAARGEGDAPRDGATMQGARGARTDGGSQTLAIFLPDGTAVFAPIFLLSTDAGAIRALQVDTVTGKTRPVRAKSVDDDSARASDALPMDRPEFEPPVDGVRGERGR